MQYPLYLNYKADDVTEIPLEEAVQMVMDGKIPDAKTQLALLKTWFILKGK